ncbi:MAG: deoxyribose-phosphate aldolase [Phycisphaerae bacterium]
MSALPKTPAELSRLIDHTALKAETTVEQIDRLCDECVQYSFFAACVNPVWVERCGQRLAGSQTVVASVAGFPLGAALPATKADEARRAIEQGATEVDMVINLGALVGGDKDTVVRDIEAVVSAAVRAKKDALVKVILETRALTEEQAILGCRCVAEAQADFVKTSTGFHPAGGATVEHVALLRKHAAPLKVKAAGGIRDLQRALALIEAGADRLGMSTSVSLVKEMRG